VLSDSVSVLPGNGDGTFGAPAPYAAAGPGHVAAADFAGTGVDDIVASNGGAAAFGTGGTVSVLANQGDGTFTGPAPMVISFPTSVATVDLRHNGVLDVLTTDYTGGINGINRLVVLLGNGDGTFQPPRIYPAGQGAYKLIVGDFNGDGNVDVALSGAPSDRVWVFLGNGDGTFQDPVTFPAVSGSRAQVFDIAAGHFHDPNILDLVTLDSGNNVNLLLGNGDGTFQPPVTIALGRGLPGRLTVADINNDGRDDLVVSSDSGIKLLVGNGDGTFQPPVLFTLGFPEAVADLNGDGIPDLVLFSHSMFNVALGNGDGTYQTPQVIGPALGALVVGDFNGDGVLDLAELNNSGGFVSVLLGNGDGTFRAPIRSATGAEPTGLATGDFNGDGLLDLAVVNRNTFSVLVNDGNWGAPPRPRGAPERRDRVPVGLQLPDGGQFAGSPSPEAGSPVAGIVTAPAGPPAGAARLRAPAPAVLEWLFATAAENARRGTEMLGGFSPMRLEDLGEDLVQNVY
jgi:hypothetical protein